ncbi:hypothetical protein VE01_06086 [Pseudogymnoascus verrucosus]|uniref:Uncharacterized protein n=1 Tax=Pseudogymnoascus verrucosus TaxID=342668 RepID=A0A1B8GJD1_9PEZI|nr:uncharacterized protein VE01_06086 [Pseudogymnoascus verrucosus]OBT95914.1 hypothetical protein VE01_06086 [Pseudogymnoascus verrucosus]
MGRHRSGGGSSYRSDKRKTRDWDDPDGPGDAAERSPRALYERFDPENISRLWRLYDTQWHHKPGERFLTRKEFTDLLEEMHTTKITEIHDEGMRRIKEGEFCLTPPGSSSYFTSTCIYSTRKERGSTGQYNQFTESLLRFHNSANVSHEQDQSLAAPSENRIMRARSNSLDAPKVTMPTIIKTQLSPTEAEHKPKLLDIPALPPAPPSTSPPPLPTPQPTASPSPSPSEAIKQSPRPSPSPRKSRFTPLESPQPHSQTPGETPPPPPPPPQQQRQQPYIPPTPAELDSATSVIRAACAAEEAEALARHSQQVKAAKALVWIDVIKLAGEIPCLAALVGGASGEDGEAAAATKGGPEGMTESALMSAFAGLMRWEERAEKARECLVEAVGGLEGLGMGGRWWGWGRGLGA